MKETPASLLPGMELDPPGSIDMDALQRRCQQAEAALRALEQRNRIMGDSAPFGIFAVDQRGRLQGLNRQMRDMLPWPDSQILAEVNVFELQVLVEAGVSADLRRCMQTRRAMIRDYTCASIQDECHHLRFHFGPVVDPAGTVSGVMAFVENRTRFKEAQEAVKESEARYRLLFQSAPVAMVERDASTLKAYLKTLPVSGAVELGAYLKAHPREISRCMALIKTVDCNDAFLTLLDAEDKAGLLTDLPRVVMGPSFQDLSEEVIMMISQGNILPEREVTIQTVHGRSKQVVVRVMVLAGHETTMARIVISMVDISTRAAAEQALRASEQRFREQSLRDNLTGLYNQRYLYDSLPRLIQTARSQGTPLSVVFIDLDNFKSVVDAHGHLNGSRVIQEVAATLGAVLDAPAYAVAYAGDEFVVVLPGQDLEQAMDKAKKIQGRIRDFIYLQGQGKNVRLQASCGISTFPVHGDSAEAILAAADTALFDIKGTGKGAIGRYQNQKTK